MASDTYFGPDPIERLTTLSDQFANTRYNVGGNVWYSVQDEFTQDTAWTIIHGNVQDIAWNILTEYEQDIAWGISKYGISQDITWNIYAKVLYFIQQFNIKAICFGYNIKEPTQFNKQLAGPVQFAFRPDSVITDTVYLREELFDTVNISSPVIPTFEINTPIQFNFSTTQVLKVAQGSFSIKPVCFDYKIKEPTQFNKQLAEPLQFVFRPDSAIIDTAYLHEEVFDTIVISAQPTYNFQIRNPVQFTFGLKNVLHGEVPG